MICCDRENEGEMIRMLLYAWLGAALTGTSKSYVDRVNSAVSTEIRWICSLHG